MIRVLIVDDHPVVREGLRAVLEDTKEMHVVGEVGSAEEALSSVERALPDIVLLDLELPGMNGVDAIPRFADAASHPRVIILTAYDTEERVLAALKAGAVGYVLKGAPAGEIAQAIRAVAGGGSYLTPRVAARVVAQVKAPRRSGLLTARERQVLGLVARGRSNKQIARDLAITERTIKFHMTTIFNKLGADNRAQAIAIAAQRGLL